MATANPTSLLTSRQIQGKLFESAKTKTVEEWREIPECLGYRASNLGRVQSCWTRGSHAKTGGSWHDHGQTMQAKSGLNSRVKYKGRLCNRPVRQLVLEAFVGPRPEGMVATHLDLDPTNNRLSNLAWKIPGETCDARSRKYAKPRPIAKEVILVVDSFIPVEALIAAERRRCVPGTTNYEASSHGRVRSFGRWHHGKIMTPRPAGPSGRTSLLLKYRGRCVGRNVGRIVLESFSPHPHVPNAECRHLDGNPTNNHISNLRWGTRTENMADMLRHGTRRRGSRNPRAKLTESQVQDIIRRRRDGERPGPLAKEFGVSQTIIYQIIRRVRWKHVG